MIEHSHALSKKTIDLISSQRNDAIVQIKGNQEVLFNMAKELTAMYSEPISTFSQQEPKKCNRIEYRETSVFQPSFESFPYEWRGIFKTIIRVRRYTDIFDTKSKKWHLRTEISY